MTDENLGTHIDIDLSGAMDPNEPAPEDIYTLECLEAELARSKEAGNLMVKSTWEIQGGEFAGKHVFENWTLEGKGARFGQWRLKQAMVATGGNPSDPDVAVMIGKSVRALVGIQPGNEGYPDKNQFKDILG